MKEVRTGVVGVGYLGEHHARVLSILDQVHLVGVYDIDKDRAGEVAAKYRTRAFSSLDTLLKEVDAVVCAVPTERHFDVGMKILDASKHLLIEKPIAKTYQEAKILVEVAERKNIKFQVGHIERFNPATQVALKHVEEPKYIESQRISVFNPRGIDVDVVLDLMIHDIDLVLRFMRKWPVDIKATGIEVITDKIDMANVRLEYDEGEVVNLTVSRVSMVKKRKMRIFQPYAYIGIDFMRQDIVIFRKERTGEILPYFPPVHRKEPLLLELSSFINSIIYDRETECSGSEGALAVKLAEEITGSIKRRLKLHRGDAPF